MSEETTERAKFEAALAEFTEYFVKNYPGPDTIIHDPTWHAPKIFRAAKHALRATLAEPPSELKPEIWFDSNPDHGAGLAFTSVQASSEYHERNNPRRFRAPAELDGYVSIATAEKYARAKVRAALSPPPDDQKPIGEVVAHNKVGFQHLAIVSWEKGAPPIGTKLYAAPPDDQMAVDARRPPVTLQIFSELVDNADARAKRVEAAAQALLDAVDANHEKPIPLKYTIPYGAVNDLRAAMKETP